jgi:uncharacterized protein (TIGR00290 family)
MITAYLNWSGGKDSALCLFKAMKSGKYDITHLLTSVNKIHNRISMHGVRRRLLETQVNSIGIPLHTVELSERPGMAEYEQAMMFKVDELRGTGCTHAIFGDIFLEDLRLYREKKLNELNIECIFPLWQLDTADLIKEFIALGFKSIVVCVNEKFLDKSFCGRLIDESFIKDLPSNVDVCGENGEFHSFTFDGPIFKKPVSFATGEIVRRKYVAPKNSDTCYATPDPSDYGFYFCDLIPIEK